MSIQFSKSGMSTLTLERGRLFPIQNPKTANQDRYLTESNNPKVINYGDALEVMELNLAFLSKDNYDGAINGIKTWFENANINYSENSFTLTDEVGETHTVRLWQDKLNIQKVSSGRYQIKILLLVE